MATTQTRSSTRQPISEPKPSVNPAALAVVMIVLTTALS